MKESEGIFYSKNLHCKKNYFQSHKSSGGYGYNKVKAKGSNLARSCYPNFSSNPLAHPNDLTCLQLCSKWDLTIVTSYNKIIYQKENYIGHVASSQGKPEKSFLMNHNVMDFLPIDIKSHQQFALDRNQSKLNLSIEFDMENINSAFTQINKDYWMLIFEVLLNAGLHGSLMLKDDITFSVKGFDIIKGIQAKLTEIVMGVNLNSIQSVNNSMNSYYTRIFTNIQCTFGVDFTISNINLSKLHVINYYTIGNSDVKITKLYIEYSLPLCVFSWRNYKGSNANVNVNVALPFANSNIVPMVTPLLTRNTASQSQSQSQSQRQLNKYDITKKSSNQTISIAPRGNFCNWHSFMTFTTPIIFEKEDLKVIDILNSLENASIFGITPLFRTDPTFYTQIKYYPILSSLYIDFTSNYTNKLNNSISKTGHANANDTSTLDGSFFSSLSAQEEKEKEKECMNTSTTTYNNNNKSRSAIHFQEYLREIYQIPCYASRIKELVKEYTELEDITLGDISNDSWIGLIWTPSRTVQTQMESMFVNYANDTSFTVYYKLRNTTLSNGGHYLPVFGIVAKSQKGSSLPRGTPWDEVFWFSNQAKNSNKIYFTDDMCTNKQTFFTFVENANRIEL